MTHKPFYPGLTGLRGLAAVGIVLMHLRGNGGYAITGFIYDRVIASFTDLVFFFMVLSAFCLCCGYAESMQDGRCDLAAFYGRRVRRLWPLFALLAAVELACAPSWAALCEAFSDWTLLGGFLPDPEAVSVVGAGWFLGLEAVFCLCFPFFCVLLASKRRAWCAFAVCLVWSFVAAAHFGLGRASILYSACYFMAGGLCWLYRERLAAVPIWLRLAALCAAVAAYYAAGGGTLACLAVSVCLVAVGLGGARPLEANPLCAFGRVSGEVYLCHMAAFRVLERLHLVHALGDGWATFGAAAVLTLAISAAAGTVWLRLERRLP